MPRVVDYFISLHYVNGINKLMMMRPHLEYLMQTRSGALTS